MAAQNEHRRYGKHVEKCEGVETHLAGALPFGGASGGSPFRHSWLPFAIARGLGLPIWRRSLQTPTRLVGTRMLTQGHKPPRKPECTGGYDPQEHRKSPWRREQTGRREATMQQGWIHCRVPTSRGALPLARPNHRRQGWG